MNRFGKLRTSVSAIAFAITAIAAARPIQAQTTDDAEVAVPAETTETAEAIPSEPEVIETVESAEIAPVSPSDTWYSDSYARIERGLNLLLAEPTRRGTFTTIITHRTYKAFTTDPFQDLLGFDGGSLKIGLGLRYGILDDLDVGVYRLNGTFEPFDVYEFDARWRFLSTAQVGVDLALRAGITWFSERGNQAVGYSAQALASRLIANRVLLGAGIAYHSDSTNDRKSTADTNYTVSGLGVVETRLSDHWAWDLEVAAGFAGYRAKWPTFSTGPKVITNRHTFAIVVSNGQYMSSDGIISNTWRGFKDLVLGFNITREL